MRGFGLSELVATAAESVLFLFAALTQLGDVWFLLVSVTLLYWLGSERLTDDPRRTGAFLVALALGGFVLTIGLKSSFALPRPPGAASVTPPAWLPAVAVPVFRNIATGTGFGFPSGHAIATTVVYGGLAALLDVWTRRRRALVAAALVALVSFARIALGVHYLVDVAVGAVVGLLFLGVVLRVADGRPLRMFAITAVVAALSAVAAAVGGHPVELRESLAGLSASVGGLFAWHRVGVTDAAVSPPLAAVGLVVAGGLWVGARQATAVLPSAVTLVVYATAVALIVAYPRLVAAVRG
ncbi:PAP2 superfamily protein [Halogranum amylolyticum]|uniref:PAP2 superfamily protein n=1 Tax=Halogranum amylolyticum TaxID=660520 RepID=A0A1H8QNC1_9EURY|nr:phosphatase PAP2 family protein [Halogranum amylolyticum]SEO55725.1 PAP2 superfamily protein [Halogranum amylolyticum]